MRYVLLALVCLLAVYAIPHRVCARRAPKFFEGNYEAARRLVTAWRGVVSRY
ncbi:MAG TPA: hypothetical protein VFB62_10795 [Polyangiaceae bacterium]|nr:hypothetical protein [Polyangiaceae bacterium]